MELKEIGAKIRDRRKELGMSQQELADAVGYADRGLISRVEAGTVNLTMDKMIKIAEKLRVPIYYFFDTYDNKPVGTSYDKSYGRNVRTIKFEHDIIYEAFRGLDEDEIKRVLEYARMIKESKLWQQQSGTERDGGSGSQRTDIPVPSLWVLPDEKDDSKSKNEPDVTADSPASQRLRTRGSGTSKNSNT